VSHRARTKASPVRGRARNNLDRPVFDGIEPARAGGMARERGLRFIGLSEAYPLSDWNEDRRAAVARLVETARAAGAETVSLIPRVDGQEGDGAERATTLRAVLPMLNGTGVVGPVERIGFSTSSSNSSVRLRLANVLNERRRTFVGEGARKSFPIVQLLERARLPKLRAFRSVELSSGSSASLASREGDRLPRGGAR
jgi:hypothetical protein